MSFDPLVFRKALGKFPTGVCVVAAEPEGEAPFGMTINSFSSVSLDPPLVLWSIQNNSECFPLFEKAATFSINILADDQQDISNTYAKKGSHELAAEHFHMGAANMPVINGAIASFECKVWARYPGGDHVILVGEVVEMEEGELKKPILFHDGAYGNIA
ncbi:flavin reductase family protein [Dasania sp. GY-MA-18]|uniref:Flavin reductase family protein n=1 Tax=Dasania phycosphaerae TaxID=2950436 RepID=A0A9J6RRE7_9GAMM|nr:MULTISPECIES: flavin reductase family protein [Dasania]MCR8924277.1 flavin reductase family protein [Dasania sp. GY-MA-18]MCZ0866930.1 flavin reductase family protein [Dasania phycosphaerae]MCZ0870434.1 flavin reductase family protein [Dasania phycosphaerae]